MTKKEAITFRRTVKELMQKNNVTGVQLAEVVGVNKSTISEWLNGKYLPSGIRIVKIAKYFHVSVSYLIGKDTTPYETPNQLTTAKFVALTGNTPNPAFKTIAIPKLAIA